MDHKKEQHRYIDDRRLRDMRVSYVGDTSQREKLAKHHVAELLEHVSAQHEYIMEMEKRWDEMKDRPTYLPGDSAAVEVVKIDIFGRKRRQIVQGKIVSPYMDLSKDLPF